MPSRDPGDPARRAPNADQAAAASLLARVGRRRAFVAIARYGGIPAALAETADAGRGREGIQPETILALCERYALTLSCYFDRDFPAALRHIPDPPLLLYVRGHAGCLHEPSFAVVGARRCSRMGADMASELAGELVRGGFTVVSGLARGIDAAAHRGALAAAQGGCHGVSTVAVMGAGLGAIYPRSNTLLAQDIVSAGGALVSEYLPTAPPSKYQFPERNRLISGLSRAVLVVEAGAHSGSLITARFALEQGREVMAVPGAVAPGLSRGCHRLLRDGAALVECSGDLFDALGCARPAEVPEDRDASQVSAALASVLAALEPAVTTLDELVASTGLAPAEVTAKLVELELAGFVQQVAAGYIRRPFPRSS